MTVYVVMFVGKYETYPKGIYSTYEEADAVASMDSDYVVEEWVVDEGRV